MATAQATFSLSPLDAAVVGLFLLAILALGFSARLRSNTILQFLAAGRSLTLPFFVATLVTTWYGGILGVAESVKSFGVGAWLLLGVPYYAFALVYGLFFAARVREADQLSIPERLEARWGKAVALLGASLVFLLAVPAAHVLMLGVLAQTLTGWAIEPAVVVGAVVGTLFLYKGGLLADVRVGALAFIMMYVGFAVILGWCLSHYSLRDAIDHLPPAQRTLTGGNGPIVILSFFILGAWTLIDPGFHQRVASSASPAVGRRGVFVSVGFWFLFDMLSMGTALYALALLPPPGEPTAYSALQIYPLLGNQVLPNGLKAVFFCGMLGTILSAMVGYTLVSGTTVGREVIGRIWRRMPDSAVTNWSRVGLAVGCLVAVALALSIESVVGLWYLWGGCVIGALLLPVSIAYLWNRPAAISRGWIFASMALAFAVSFSWLVYALRTKNDFLNVAWIKVHGSWRPTLPQIADRLTLPEGDRLDVSVGTLLPGLVISGCVLTIGALAGRRNAKHG